MRDVVKDSLLRAGRLSWDPPPPSFPRTRESIPGMVRHHRPEAVRHAGLADQMVKLGYPGTLGRL